MKARFSGVIVTALLLAGAYAFWQSSGSSTVSNEDGPPVRGGQVVATIRSEPRSFNRIVARDRRRS